MKRIALLMSVGVGIVWSFTNAFANQLAHSETIIGTDLATAGVGGMRSNGVGQVTLSGVSGSVTRAFLYWHGPSHVTDLAANATVMFNGIPITGVNIGVSGDNSWAFHSSHAYRADVSALVSGNGTFQLSGFRKPGGIDVNGASLVVFYDDGNPANDRNIAIFHGNDSNFENAHDPLGWRVVLGGLQYSVGQGFLELHVADGQVWPESPVLGNGQVLIPGPGAFAGNTVPSANTGPGGKGALWDIQRVEITPLLLSGTNSITLTQDYRDNGDSLSLVLALADLSTPPVNQPPLVTCGAPVVTNQPGAITLTARVDDGNGDPLLVMVSVNGSLVETRSVPAGELVRFTHTFGVGDHVVSFTVTDGEAEARCSVTVTVRDTEPPVITCPPDMIAVADADACSAVVTYPMVVIDDLPGASYTCSHPSGMRFPVGVTTVTCMGVDAAGNVANCQFTVRVVDDQDPVIDVPPTIVVRGGDAGCDGRVVYEVSVSDNCPGATVICQPVPGSIFPVGVTTVVCSARDASGNLSTGTFEVVVEAGPGELVLRKTANRLTVGPDGQVTYIYEAINAGCGELSALTIVDDNGTPTFVGDDFVVVENVTLGAGETRIFTRTVFLPITISNDGGSIHTGILVTERLGNGNIKVAFIQDLRVNDNTYGVNVAPDWTKSHTFGNLMGSDKAVFTFTDGNGAEVLSFKMDYISESSAFPSGYGSLGVSGKEGGMLEGSAAHVLAASTSLAENLNKEPFLSNLAKYTRDSPALGDPNSPFWEYRMIYTVVVSSNAFGGAGFGRARIVDQHNSPAKLGSFEPTPIDIGVTNVATATYVSGGVTGTTSATAVVQLDAGGIAVRDTDNDGLADDWEVLRFGSLNRDGTGDADGDGQPDLAEFQAGTDPNDAASMLTILGVAELAGGAMEITWSSVVGRTYRVQYCEELGTGWKDLPGIVRATGVTASLVDPGNGHAGQRFYQVLLIP